MAAITDNHHHNVESFWESVEEETLRPLETSNETLMRVLDENKNTVFGKERNFDKISAEQYRNIIPLSTYSVYEKYVDRILAGTNDSDYVLFNYHEINYNIPDRRPESRH